MSEMKDRVMKHLEDWKCFTWHTPEERDSIVESILDIAICGNCEMGKDGVCVSANERLKPR